MATPRAGKNRNQRDIGMVLGQLRQIERQPRSHHDRLRARGAGLAHVGRMRVHGLHHVHRHQPLAARNCQRSPDLAVKRDQVQAIELVLVAAVLRLFDQVGVMVPQIDARDRAHRTRSRHRAREPVGRHAHAHATLHDGQKAMAANGK